MKERTREQSYDIIGDIHGHASPLRALLEKLGYQEQGGAYRHPERKVIFLGDFIDRGPCIREVLQTVRAMTDSGSALAVMGNHEFNALAYHTPNDQGGFLRPHTSSNQHQHQATLDQIATPCPTEWQDWLAWFRTLPLFLDLGGLRAAHAGWNGPAVALARTLGPLTPDLIRAMVDKTTSYGHAKNMLLNGVEITLPDGYFIMDRYSGERREIRVRWWMDLAGRTFRDVVFSETAVVPALPLGSDTIPAHHLPYPPSEPPVFNGHYWLKPVCIPVLQASNIAVLDYSVALGGMLVAYRWDGEQQLSPEKFVTVNNDGAASDS